MTWGPPAGSPFAGQSASAASQKAGLPFAGIPQELVDRVTKLLDSEPEHPEPDVAFSQTDYDRRPFTLRRFLANHKVGMSVAFALVVVETLTMLAGPLLTEKGIDD